MSYSQIQPSNPKNNTVRRLSQKTIAFNSVAPPTKVSQSLEPVACVSTKPIPIIPTSNRNSVVKMAPSSQYYDSQTVVSQQINHGGNYYNNGSTMPFQQQNRQQQEFSSFVSNQDQNNDKKSEFHIVTPNDQSFSSNSRLQLNSTIPISQQGQNGNCNYQQGQQRNLNTIYQRLPSGQQFESFKQAESSAVNSQQSLTPKSSVPFEFKTGQRQIVRQQSQNSQTKETSAFGQQQQQSYRSIQSLQPSQQINVKQFLPVSSFDNKQNGIYHSFAQNSQVQYQNFNSPNSERAIPALKPSISQQSNEIQNKINQLPVEQFELQEVVKRSNPNQNYQIQNQNLQISPYQYTFEKYSARGESAPPVIGTSSLSSSVQGLSYQQQYMNSSNNDPYWNSTLNASVFNVVVNDQDEIGEQIKRQRIDSQQQNSFSKQQSPEGKKIQNSTYIDYSYKKSITDKALATQVQQSNNYYLNDIWNKPPLPEKPKDTIKATQQIGKISSPEFGAISKPEQQQYQEVYIQEAPIVETTVQTIQEAPITNSDLISFTAYKADISSSENNTQLQQTINNTDLIKPVIKYTDITMPYQNTEAQSIFNTKQYEPINITTNNIFQQPLENKSIVNNIGENKSIIGDNILSIENIKTNITSIPTYQPIEVMSRNSGNIRSNTVEPIRQNKEETISPLKQKLLEELRQEQQVRQSSVEENKTSPSKLKILEELRQEQKTRQSTHEENKITPSKFQILEELRQEQKTRQSTHEENAGATLSNLKILDELRQEQKTRESSHEVNKTTPSKLKILEELKQEQKTRQSTYEDSIKRSQKSDNYKPTQNILVVDQYNNNTNENKTTTSQLRSFSTEPYIGGLSYLSSQFESQLSQLPSISSNQDKKIAFDDKNKTYQSNEVVNATGNLNKEYIDSLLKNYDLNKQNKTTDISITPKNSSDISNKNFNLEESVKRSSNNKQESGKKENNEYNNKNLTIFSNVNQDTNNLNQYNPITYANTTTYSSNSVPKYESLYKNDFNNNITKIEQTKTAPIEPIQSNYGYLSQNLYSTNVIQPQSFGVTYERQNLHKEKLHSRQNSDQNMIQSEKQEQDTKMNKIINSITHANKNTFDVSQNTSNYVKSYLNTSEPQIFAEEKKKLREVKSVDHLLIQQRFIDPKIEEEVKGWVNPIFEEFIRKNFRDGKFNTQDVQEAIKRSKSLAGFTNGISPVVLEEQLLTLIEQQKKLIDQQNVQIQIQNEVQKSQLHASSHISSPKPYYEQKNYLVDNTTISQGQLNNSNSKSHSQLLHNLPQYDNQSYTSSGINGGIGSLNSNNYASQFSYNKNNYLTGQDAISSLSKESQGGNIYSSYPTKIPNPIGGGYDIKHYQTAPQTYSTYDNYNRNTLYPDQIIATQNNDQIEFNLTESGHHDDYKNLTQLQNVLISPSNSAFTYGQNSISPQPKQNQIQYTDQDKSLLQNLNSTNKNNVSTFSNNNHLSQINSLLNQNSNQLLQSAQDNNKKEQASIDINNLQHHDDEMQLEDLTPFNNNLHDRAEVDLRAQANASQAIYEDNEDKDENNPNLKMHHSKSMGSEQGQDENESDQYVAKYYSENNSLRDQRDSSHSKQKNDQYNSSSPSELTDRDDNLSDKVIDGKQIYNNKKKKNDRQNSKITEESYSNKNDGSQLTALNVNLYKQNQLENYYIEEYTPSKPEVKNNQSSVESFNNQNSPQQEEQRQLSVTESPNDNIQTQSSVAHDDINQQTPQKHSNSKESEDEIKIVGSQNMRCSQENNFSPLEKVEEEQEYIHKDASAKNSARNNKSDFVGVSPNVKKEQNSAGGQKSRIPKSSKSSLYRGESNDHLKRSQELKKFDSSDSNYELLASDQIKKMRETLDKKARKDSSQSANSVTYEVFQDIQQHVQDKIKKYDQMSNKKQKESDHVIERSGSNTNRSLFSSPKKNLEIANDEPSVKLSGKVIKKSQDQQKNIKKKDQTIFDILSSKQSTLKRNIDKHALKTIECSSNSSRNKQSDSEKASLAKQTQNNKKDVSKNQKGGNSQNLKSLASSSKSPEQSEKIQKNIKTLPNFNISQITTRSQNQSQVQSPRQELLQSNKSNKKGGEENQKVFVLHKNMTFEHNNQQKTSNNKVNTDQQINKKQLQVNDKKEALTERKSSAQYQITISQPQNLNKNKQTLTQSQKQQKSPPSINQISVSNNYMKTSANEQQSNQSSKKAITQSNIIETNDPNTLNLYQKFQDKKLQEKELVTSQVFQNNKQEPNNVNISHISQNNEQYSLQNSQQQKDLQLKSPENIYQQNQNLRYQQQQQISNQTKSNNQQAQSYSTQQQNKNQLKKQSDIQAYNQKQREQLERIQTRLQQEEEEYQQLIQSQPTNDVTTIPPKSGKHLSPTQSEKSTIQNFNKFFMNSPKDGNSKILPTSQSQQRMMSLESNNFYTQDGTYTQDYEEYLYQEYIRDQREKLIQKNIKEGVNSGQLTEDQQQYMNDLEKIENRHKFQEFIKRNQDWVLEKERKIREQQQQKADMEMQECTFKPMINQSTHLDVKPVFVPSTKSSRLLEEQNKLKINSSQNSMNHIPSSKSLRRSNQGSRVGSEAYIQVDGKNSSNTSRKFSNRLSPPLQPFNTPPNYAMFIQQQERSYSNLEKQGSAELKKDIEDVLGILKNFTQTQN